MTDHLVRESPPQAGEAGEPLPPPRGNTSLRPAFLVVAIAVVLIVVFSVFALATSGDDNAGTPPAPSPSARVPGTPLKAEAATRALAPIEQPGSPPANIVASVVLPVGATRVSVTDNSGNADQYDQQMTFSVPSSQGAVFAFYRAEMHRDGWRVFSVGLTRDHRGEQVLGQKAGDDGWYWEMGAVVDPTSFASTSAGRGTGAETTRFTVRLFQVPDPS